MSVQNSATLLSSLTKDLCARWQQTRESWTDDKAREFEQRFMDELLAGVSRTVTQIQDLEKVLAKIRKDCE